MKRGVYGWKKKGWMVGDGVGERDGWMVVEGDLMVRMVERLCGVERRGGGGERMRKGVNDKGGKRE